MENWDVYDADRNKLDRLHTRGVKMKEGEYHLTVEVWILNSVKQVLLSQRHPIRNNGLLWECSGGSVLAGECSLDGAVREVKEELGIDIKAESLKFIGSDMRKDYIVDIYVCYCEIELERIKMQLEEVIGVKFVSIEELIEMGRNNELVNSSWERFQKYKTKIVG